ncbi:MAG: TerB family tellurite resistance protein [Rhodospirillales bacterium]|nr:TerB family tellurite resistance protein [Rhodospirillales bacterium]MCB9995318.1 TerB family tellurite resistance protein [Rhodospirillales bacterium]
MTIGVSESRFYMWRAIFAIAHVDGKIDKQEEAFMDTHLKTVDFSPKQKAVLEDDIIHAKDPGEMLAHVTSSEDQGMFFEFARMMVWSDGNYDVQEKEIMQRLLGAHMEQLDMGQLTKALHESREKAQARNEEDNAYIKAQAQKKVGVGPLIGRLFASPRDKKLPRHEVTESQFYMWRAIFALAHADHEVTTEERKFMYGVLNNENFSNKQRLTLENDIERPQDVAEMFMSIAEQEDRSRFFYYARMLCWADGNFDEQEQEIMLVLKKLHVRNVDFVKMLDKVDMELDDGQKDMLTEDMKDGNPLISFLKRMRS